ncbi:hypothetical protein K2Z84_32665 [Candidatus Binatia bacterium]|nr:hypothetical protein [Candidatus Binatia bacterium]
MTVRTPPPSLEETARTFGVSDRELERVKRLVGRIVARSKGAEKLAVARPRPTVTVKASGRRPRGEVGRIASTSSSIVRSTIALKHCTSPASRDSSAPD